jgi:5-methylcytosine-specific restriction endonuclease McrA
MKTYPRITRPQSQIARQQIAETFTGHDVFRGEHPDDDSKTFQKANADDGKAKEVSILSVLEMKSYTKAFMKHHGYDVSDFIPCLSCGARANDLHHILPRSTHPELLNEVSNLAALCRICHIKAESDKEFNETLKTKNYGLTEKAR